MLMERIPEGKKSRDTITLNKDTRSMCSGFASLAMGSSFWHGSHTILGNLADNRFIDVLAFTIHQVKHQETVVIKKRMSPCPI
jgi:hypothetical protein